MTLAASQHNWHYTRTTAAGDVIGVHVTTEKVVWSSIAQLCMTDDWSLSIDGTVIVLQRPASKPINTNPRFITIQYNFWKA